MLSSEEKKEMLEDARSKSRQEDFRFAKRIKLAPESLDEYISFLDSAQKIFGAFKTSYSPPITKFNRL